MQKHTQTHTLGAAEVAEAAAAAVTSLLGRRVTDEPEHIVLALEMSRGVKMSPQIAPGHQMSPFHSTPPPSLPPCASLLLFSLCTSFHLLPSFHLTLLFSSLSSSAPLSSLDTVFLFISSTGQRQEENRVKESEFSKLCSSPLCPSLISILYSLLYSSLFIHPFMYLSIHPSIHQHLSSRSLGQQGNQKSSYQCPLYLDIFQTPSVHPGDVLDQGCHSSQ